MIEPERPQGTTDRDLASTRVVRSVSFCVVMLVYGINLVVQRPVHLTGQRFYGWGILVLSLLVTVLSLMKVDVTSQVRTASFLVLSGLLAALLYWAASQDAYLVATLLALPIFLCWIEVGLAYRVRMRREEPAPVYLPLLPEGTSPQLAVMRVRLLCAEVRHGDSSVVDPDFARGMQYAVKLVEEALEPPSWLDAHS